MLVVVQRFYHVFGTNDVVIFFGKFVTVMNLSIYKFRYGDECSGKSLYAKIRTQTNLKKSVNCFALKTHDTFYDSLPNELGPVRRGVKFSSTKFFVGWISCLPYFSLLQSGCINLLSVVIFHKAVNHTIKIYYR